MLLHLGNLCYNMGYFLFQHLVTLAVFVPSIDLVCSVTRLGYFWNILAAKFRPKLYLAAFWAIWKNITLYVKPTMATFCQLFNKIGLLFIPLSGHTESCDENDSRRHNTCEKCTIPNSGTILIFWLKTSSVTSFVNILSFWQYFESHWRLCDGLFSV